MPWLLAAFGAAYLLNFLGYLREHLRWSLLWSAMLIVSLTGLLYLADNGGLRGKLHETIGAQSIGGWLGWLTYGQTQNRNFGFSLLGPLGATIVYAALGLISLLFLTNFQLGEWIRALFDKESGGGGSRTKITRGNRPGTPRARSGKTGEKIAGGGRRALRPRRGPASPCPNRPCAT